MAPLFPGWCRDRDTFKQTEPRRSCKLSRSTAASSTALPWPGDSPEARKSGLSWQREAGEEACCEPRRWLSCCALEVHPSFTECDVPGGAGILSHTHPQALGAGHFQHLNYSGSEPVLPGASGGNGGRRGARDPPPAPAVPGLSLVTAASSGPAVRCCSLLPHSKYFYLIWMKCIIFLMKGFSEL